MRTAILICISFISVYGYSQGKIDGFYKGSGQGSAVIGLGFEDSKKYYAGTEAIDVDRTVYYGSFFAAYGITDALDINLSLPYIVSDDNRDFQDMLFMVKYRLYEFNFKTGIMEFSVAAGLSTPVSDYAIGGLNDIGQQATVIEPRAMVHYKSREGWFTTLQSGFSYKFEEVPNSLPVTFKAGHAGTLWYYDIYYDYQYAFSGIDYLETPRPQNFREFGVDFHKIGGTLYHAFSEEIGIYGSLSYMLSGRNVFSGAGYGIGGVYNF